MYGLKESLGQREGLGEVQEEAMPCTRRRVVVSTSLECRMSTVRP